MNYDPAIDNSPILPHRTSKMKVTMLVDVYSLQGRRVMKMQDTVRINGYGSKIAAMVSEKVDGLLDMIRRVNQPSAERKPPTVDLEGNEPKGAQVKVRIKMRTGLFGLSSRGMKLKDESMVSGHASDIAALVAVETADVLNGMRRTPLFGVPIDNDQTPPRVLIPVDGEKPDGA